MTLPTGPEFFERDPLICARELIGARLEVGDCAGEVVETEAYRTLDDPACHSFMRPSARQFIEERPAGSAYVYLNYGIHWLLNFLCKGGGHEGFVLIRALRPAEGLEEMRERRGGKADRELCSGPAKLTQALGIDGGWHGREVLGGDLKLTRPAKSPAVLADGRIGISKAQEFPWRFTARDAQQWVSRKWRG